MTFTINAIDLAVTILVILAVVLGIYIAKTLSKLNKTLNSINELIEANKNNVSESIKSFPEICDNLNSITKSIRDKTDTLDEYLVKNDEAAASFDFESIVSGISSIAELFSEIRGYFGHKKKRYLRK